MIVGIATRMPSPRVTPRSAPSSSIAVTGSRVRRDEAVHRRETGECRDADGDQRDLRSPGDEVDDRHQQDQADLEEHRQPDDRPHGGHRPGQRRDPRPGPRSCRRPGRRRRSRPAAWRTSRRGRSARRRPRRSCRTRCVNEAMTSSRFSPAMAPTVRPPMVSARNGLSLTTVIRKTRSAIATRVAVISCQPGATGWMRSSARTVSSGVMSVLLADAEREVPLDDLVHTAVDLDHDAVLVRVPAARGSRTAR